MSEPMYAMVSEVSKKPRVWAFARRDVLDADLRAMYGINYRDLQITDTIEDVAKPARYFTNFRKTVQERTNWENQAFNLG